MNTIPCRTILFLLSLTLTSLCFAFPQTLPIDSLEAVLAAHTRADTAKVNLLNKLAYGLYIIDVKKAKSYSKQSHKLAVELNYPEGKAASLWTMGLTSLESDKKVALDYFKQALHIAEQVNDQRGICNYLIAISNVVLILGDAKTSELFLDSALQVSSTLKDRSIRIKILYNISFSLTNKAQYPEAVEKLQQMIDLATEIDDKVMLAKAYSDMAIIFNRQGNAPQALEYFHFALRICEQLDDQPTIFYKLINIAGIKSDMNEGQAALETLEQAFKIARKLKSPKMISICLANTGNIYQRMKRPEALRYFQEALGMSRKTNVGLSINLLMNIGAIYTEQGKFNEAEKDLNEALEMAEKVKNEFAYSEVLRLLGSLYYEKKEYIKALNCTSHALQLSTKIQHLEVKKDSYELLSNIYSAIGNYKDAYRSQKQFKQLNDSIFNEKNVRKIALLESAYKHDKEKEKYELEKNNQQLKIKNQYYLILFFIAITILLIILSYQIYLSNRFKKKALHLEIDKVNNQLEYSQKEMASATLKLVQNSESDTYCIKMLKSIEGNTTEEGEKNVRSLINYYKNKSSYSNWEEFEALFLKVNSDFYDKLNARFPTLSLNERKLCIFLNLNMTNKDITQITFQSEEALKKARMRLRKKLNLDHDQNLTSFMQNL